MTCCLLTPFKLPIDNYKIYPKPTDERLCAVCDSGISTDNKYNEKLNTLNLRYCTLYQNSILGCEDPYQVWCCEYYSLDTLAVELGILEEGVGVGEYCEEVSLKNFGRPLLPP